MEGNAALFRWRESLSVESGISRNGTERNGMERNGMERSRRVSLTCNFFSCTMLSVVGVGRHHAIIPLLRCHLAPFFKKNSWCFSTLFILKAKMLTVGSLFTGIGGIDLGLEQTGGFRIAWQVEISPYCCRLLAYRWPHIPRYGDICQLDFSQMEPVDVLAGGFPCQDVSLANRRREGLDGARSGLWGEFVRAIVALRPRYVLVENVDALRYAGTAQKAAAPLGRILGDLAGVGYDAEWCRLSAAALGYSHYRPRLFIIAYPEGSRREALLCDIPMGYFTQREGPSVQLDRRGCVLASLEQSLRQPSVFGSDPGIPSRLDRLTALGNSVMPEMARVIGACILVAEANEANETESRMVYAPALP